MKITSCHTEILLYAARYGTLRGLGLVQLLGGASVLTTKMCVSLSRKKSVFKKVVLKILRFGERSVKSRNNRNSCEVHWKFLYIQMTLFVFLGFFVGIFLAEGCPLFTALVVLPFYLLEVDWTIERRWWSRCWFGLHIPHLSGLQVPTGETCEVGWCFRGKIHETICLWK